jgi:membrane protease YdiL (CAAX protease family)
VTSLVFGFAHLYQGSRGIEMTAVGGLVVGVAYVITGSLILPMQSTRPEICAVL